MKADRQTYIVESYILHKIQLHGNFPKKKASCIIFTATTNIAIIYSTSSSQDEFKFYVFVCFVTGQIPDWWGWGYWISPLTYSFNAFTVNEMFAPRWMDKMVCMLKHFSYLYSYFPDLMQGQATEETNSEMRRTTYTEFEQSSLQLLEIKNYVYLLTGFQQYNKIGTASIEEP